MKRFAAVIFGVILLVAAFILLHKPQPAVSVTPPPVPPVAETKPQEQSAQTPVALVTTPIIAIPPEPSVRPLISETYPGDTNQDGIEDALFDRAQTAKVKLKTATIAEEKVSAQAELDAPVDVELIFGKQITQAQIDSFLALGGEITHVYKAVSYGWNGRIALGKVTDIPSVMALPPVLIQEAKPAVLHMDTATRTGRVRPVWAAGFAGNPAGFDGDTNITIGIVDTGVDESHTDLTNRRAYWHDYTTDNAASPVDVVQHGSHVAGIALGTGAAGGSGAGTMYYTQEGSLSGVPNGSFYPSPIELPAVSLTYTATARWSGGGSTTLYLVYHTRGVSGGWAVQGSGVAGTSPLTINVTFTGSTTREYSTALLSNGSMTDFVVTSQVLNYPSVGDGFNKFSGVAPGCRWAGAKVFSNAGSGNTTTVSAGIDDLVANRTNYNIKVMNLSLGSIGDPGLDTTERMKVNTAVNNGIVVVVSAGNDGSNTNVAKRTIDDPGRAAMALTVAAGDDNNQLTDYTSQGFTSPGSTAGLEEDYKPDVMAPGGSQNYYSSILSVDSNSRDGTGFTEQQSNDYYNIQGTSMASPFTAGCAAMLIDAFQQSGVTWDFTSSKHARYVKMLLCATASESNANREDGGSRSDGNVVNPTLQRASAGPNSFPVCKDQYEGYGMINPDAAVEAISQTYTYGVTNTAALGPAVTDRRVWARTVNLIGGQAFNPTLSVPASGDFDLYLYNATPGAYGTPVLLASSTQTNSGTAETLSYTPPAATNGLLVIKRVSGSGTFTVTSDKANQTITFPVIADQITTNTTGLYATASSGLPVSFSVGSGPASISGGTNLSFTGAGTVSIVATQSGNTNWNAASAVTNFLSVTKAPASVTLQNLDQLYDGTPRVVTAVTAPTGLVVDVTYDGSATVPVNSGSYAVTGTVNDVMYSGAASGTLTVTYVADVDGDGIPNDWETQYFGGITNADPNALAANGINTIRQAYIIGLNPTNAQNVFTPAEARLQDDNLVFDWLSASGRVYSIYWSSNLLGNFTLMQSNYTGGVFTDTTHNANDGGFYRVEVRLAP